MAQELPVAYSPQTGHCHISPSGFAAPQFEQKFPWFSLPQLIQVHVSSGLLLPQFEQKFPSASLPQFSHVHSSSAIAALKLQTMQSIKIQQQNLFIIFPTLSNNRIDSSWHQSGRKGLSNGFPGIRPNSAGFHLFANSSDHLIRHEGFSLQS
ncbi:MAG: hypothetical protein UF351_02660 [Christensenellales bacterium]|nr:hypothetical protein [Christensenellales bacterium]